MLGTCGLLKKYWAELVLAGIVVLTAFLDLWNLWIQSFSVIYYAAAVRSMLANPGIAFFNSFDSVGFVTVDKPPLGLWAQAASAAVFGFNSWSVVLPQALAGIGSVILIYFIVQRPFGKPAGLIAAFALATTPIFVSTAREGTMDMQMIFVILLALWVALKAAREQSLWLLLLSFALVGIGFNIKMVQAYVILPALIVIYLFGSNLPTRQKMVHLILALLVLAAVSLSWAIAVDSVPTDQRPYIGTSGDNSVIGLILGHNGQEAFVIEERVWAEDGIGAPGLFRLFNSLLYVQFAWLLPFALLGILAWVRQPATWSSTGLKEAGLFSEKGITLMALCLWLVPALLYFSFTHGNWTSYYLATIAPPFAALVGIGAVALYNEYLGNRVTGWVLVAALLGTAFFQIGIFVGRWIYAPQEYGIILILLIGGSVLGAIILTVLRIKKMQRITSPRPQVIICVAVAALMVAPAVWSAGIPFMRVQSPLDSTDPQFSEFLLSHAGNSTYLVAVPDSLTASALIIPTGKPVMAIGGYFGTDQILSVNQIPGLIQNNTVRYFLILQSDLPANYRIARDPGVNAGIYSWVEDHCMAVPAAEWRKTNWNYLNPYALYDCAGAA